MKLLRLLLLFLAISVTSMSYAEQINTFTSDGCSAFPNGNLVDKKLWLRCCTLHDYAYWQGGTYQQRVVADHNLRECVKEVGEPSIALIMLIGVRLGGSPYWPTSFRWGYGWHYLRGYQPLSADEKEQIKALSVDLEAYY